MRLRLSGLTEKMLTFYNIISTHLTKLQEKSIMWLQGTVLSPHGLAGASLPQHV